MKIARKEDWWILLWLFIGFLLIKLIE